MRVIRGWLVAVPMAFLAALGIALLLVLALQLPGGGNASSDPLDLDLERQITEFVQAQPLRSGYRQPETADRERVAAGVAKLLDGDLDAAKRTLAEVGYGVFTGVDRDTRRKFAEVYDTQHNGRGWGRVLVDLSAPPRLAVQVPHPGSDMWSELMGLELYREVPGSVLVIAGANRRAGPGNAADMAHRRDTVFFSVVEMLRVRSLRAVQLHGFSESALPQSDAVISAGPPKYSGFAAKVAEVLDRTEFRICRPWLQTCGELEATTNVQGDAAFRYGGDFVHVEVNQTVRSSQRWRRELVRALARMLEGQETTNGVGGPSLPEPSGSPRPGPAAPELDPDAPAAPASPQAPDGPTAPTGPAVPGPAASDRPAEPAAPVEPELALEGDGGQPTW